MDKKIFLKEINNYRKLMGLPMIVEQNEVKQEDVEEKNINIVEAIFNESESSEILDLLEGTNKTLEELLNTPNLTESEFKILIKISEIKNLSALNTIMDNIYISDEYKKVLINEYKLELNLFVEEMKSTEGITKYEYPSCVKEFTIELINFLNKDFKNVENIILGEYETNIKSQWTDYEMTEIANSYNEHAIDETDYFYLSTVQPNYSGWKFYIYAENTTDVIDLLILVGDYLKNSGVVFKASTKKNFDAGVKKGIIIYLPYSMVIDKKQKEFIDAINSEITNYTKTGTIDGTKSYNGKIFYSYEFNKKFDRLPKDGVKYDVLSKYYVPNLGGDYMKNIKQSDLFDGL